MKSDLRSQIIETLSKLNGCAIGSFNSRTRPVLKGGKKNPFQGKVEKVAEKANVMFFCNGRNNSYETMVKKRLASEGKAPESFTLNPRPWGVRVPETPFVEHKGALYLECIYLHPPKKVVYLVDGVEFNTNEIPGLDTDKEEGEQGGLENKVIIRTFKLESIEKIEMGGLSVEMNPGLLRVESPGEIPVSVLTIPGIINQIDILKSLGNSCRKCSYKKSRKNSHNFTNR